MYTKYDLIEMSIIFFIIGFLTNTAIVAYIK